jgi:AraC-like DNA-binding protein
MNLSKRPPDIDSTEIELLRQQVTQSRAVAKLQKASQDLLGGALLFLARQGDQVIEIHPSGEEDLPEFCRLYRSSSDGLECCTTCRSLMAFGTCYRGTLEYSCHGGVRILASPAQHHPESDMQVVIASCAFARPEREEGWQEFRDHAQGLGIDLRKLRAAYKRMPVLTDDKRHIALSLVEISACVMNDLSGPSGPKAAKDRAVDPPPGSDELDQLMASSICIPQAQSSRQTEAPQGALLVERIRNMLSRHPSMPFTLKGVARAAEVSPNHLSGLFHRVAGVTFSDFLLAQRIKLAKRLLRDLSLSVQAVAKRSGFPNGSYFSRRFRHQTGMTPTAWRRSV